VKQTRTASAVESIANIIIGFLIQYFFLYAVLYSIGVTITWAQNFYVGVVMTVVSLIRAYALRRLFEELRVKGILK